MPIPVIILEEHNEALIAWHYAIQKNLVPAEGNLLLHVDEHADLEAPHLNESLCNFPKDLDEIARFTYDNVAIYEFIITAI